MVQKLIHKLRRCWMRMRLRPIRVYCLHHVCAEFDPESMYACDWTQIDEFKHKVLAIQHEEVEFISLTEAYKKITNNKFRKAKYAVLTFDDGYASLKEILPWLEKQHMPVTLFINGKYLDGKSYRKTPKEQYLAQKELFELTSPFIEIASHGWEHVRATQQKEEEFANSVAENVALLATHPRYIPFHAYTYGSHNEILDEVLYTKALVPVLIDGMKNYNDRCAIHRELLDV